MTKRHRVAIFSLLDTPAFGGAEQYMFSHLYFLNQRGYEIILATNNTHVEKEFMSRLSTDQKKTFHIIKAPYRLDAIGNWKGLIKFFFSLPKSLLWCFSTLRQLKKHYDQVICLWPGFSDRLVFSPLAKFFHFPLIWIEIGPLEPTFKRNLGFPKLLYRLSERFPNHIITTSLFTKQSILRNTTIPSTTVTLVYPGTKLFSQQKLINIKKLATTWKAQQQLTTMKVITVVARLAQENEIDMVIRAFHLYLQKNMRYDVKLIIVGDGPERKTLEVLVKKLNLTTQIQFFGFVSEEQKQIILSASMFFVFPRAWDLDGFGMTTIEAMSLGLPVLTTNFGPQIEIINNGKEGYKYKPHDSKNLALYIEKLINSPKNKLTTMSKNALRRVQEFSDVHSQKNMYTIIKQYTDENNYDKTD